MAVIVETGAIVASANSYVSLAQADTYHEDQGNTAWANFDDEVKEAALLRGTLMLEAHLNGRWFGVKTNNNASVAPQIRAWPRRDNVNSATAPIKDADGIEIGINTVPLVVQQAQMEVAFMQASGFSLIPNRNAGGATSVKRNKVDVIEQEFFKGSADLDSFPLIDQLLQSVATVGGVNLTMVVGLSDAEQDALNSTSATQRYLDSINT